jgi:hypothetical protein
MKMVIILSAALLASTAAAVSAQDKTPCADDIKNLCSGYKGSMADCLKANKDDLTDACKASLTVTSDSASAQPVSDSAPQAAGDAGKSEPGGPSADVRTACKADAEQFCSDATSPQERRACMESNMDKLSDKCKTAMTAARRKAESVKPQAGPCKADAEKFCPGMKPGKELRACMEKNSESLSPACKANIAVMTACEADAKKLCPGMRPGPELGKCMQEHKDELSSACKAVAPGAVSKPQGGGMSACKADADKYCANLSGRELGDCMRDNRANLSAECKAAMKSRRQPPPPQEGDEGQSPHRSGRGGNDGQQPQNPPPDQPSAN